MLSPAGPLGPGFAASSPVGPVNGDPGSPVGPIASAPVGPVGPIVPGLPPGPGLTGVAIVIVSPASVTVVAPVPVKSILLTFAGVLLSVKISLAVSSGSSSDDSVYVVLSPVVSVELIVISLLEPAIVTLSPAFI